jgi:predicted nucleic acid-binding protein
MTYYFDSSAVVKRYAPERGSAWVKSIVQPASGNSVYLAQIGVVEIAAALSRKVRTNELRREDYEAALGLFLSDVRNAEFILIPINDHIIELTVDLTGHHPLRGYDSENQGLRGLAVWGDVFENGNGRISTCQTSLRRSDFFGQSSNCGGGHSWEEE